MVPHETGPSRPLSRHTVARASSSSFHAPFDRLHGRRVCRVHAPTSQLPGSWVCRVHASDVRLPEHRAGPPPRPPQSCLCDVRPRVSVSRSAKLTSSPGFPDKEAGSIHGPRSHEARSTSRLPARSPRPHCTGRPHAEAVSATPVTQSDKFDPMHGSPAP
jgi:hypothetical protein